MLGEAEAEQEDLIGPTTCYFQDMARDKRMLYQMKRRMGGCQGEKEGMSSHWLGFLFSLSTTSLGQEEECQDVWTDKDM